MNILFVTTHSYFPQRVGGSETSTHELCLQLIKNGHTPTVLTGLDPDSWYGFINRIKMKLPLYGKLSKSRFGGYDVFRCWDSVLNIADAIKLSDADIAVVQAGRQKDCVNALLKLNIPTVCYLHDTSFESSKDGVKPHKNLAVIANSNYTAGVYCKGFGLMPYVIPPLVRPENYITKRTGESVLFINPHPIKGLAVALKLAELNPTMPFDFVWCWGLDRKAREAIEDRAKELGNISISGPLRDMKKAYANAKILLSPTGTDVTGKHSITAEAWGLVVTEAQFSGIPVIATNKGGLPESVGHGGVLIDYDAAISEWDRALKTLYYDDKIYEEKVREALRHSLRSEIRVEVLYEKFIKICNKLTAKSA